MEFTDMKTEGRLVTWTILSDSGGVYYVSLDSTDSWSCSCPHYVFRLKKTGQICKHIRWVKEEQGSA